MKHIFALALTSIIISTIVTSVSAAPQILVSSAASAVNIPSYLLHTGGSCDTASLPPTTRPSTTSASERTNLAVSVFDGPYATITAYQPGSTTPANINQRASNLAGMGFVALSSDGRLEAWYNPYSTSTDKIQVDAIGEGIGCINIAIPKGETATQVTFLNDVTGVPHYLTYVFVDSTFYTWTLGFLDIYTHYYSEWSAVYQLTNNRTSVVGFNGIAKVLGWRPETKMLVLSTYMPSGNQIDNSIYSLDTTGLTLNNKRRPFPVAKMLIAADKGFGATLSPDGAKLAYLRADSNNQPTGYRSSQGSGSGALTPSGLTVIDSATGKTITTYDANRVEGFGTYTWTLNSQSLLFTTGAFQQTDYPITPTINTLDLKSGAVTPGGLLSNDSTAHIREIRACETALFYFVDYPSTFPQGDAQPITTIYSAPLANLATHSSLGVATSYVTFITMVNCISS